MQGGSLYLPPSSLNTPMGQTTVPPGTGVQGLYTVLPDGTYEVAIGTDGGIVAPITPGDLTLTDGQIFVGNASNEAASVAMTGDIGISNTGVTSIASGAIVNADVNASAAIGFSKLAALTDGNILVGNGSNVATAVAVSGDIAISNAGVTSIASGAIVNADVSVNAGIDFAKLAALTAGNILVGNGSNVATPVTPSGDIVMSQDGGMFITKSIINQTGSGLNPGTLVNLSTNSDGTLGVIKADSNTGVPASYVVKELIGNNFSGYVYQSTTISGLDTSTAVGIGSPIFLSTAGSYVFDTPPSGAGDLAQIVGYVKVKDASGSINFTPPVLYVFGTDQLQDDAVTAGKIGATFSFSGNALSSHNHSTTATGTVSAPTFTGDALSAHSHSLVTVIEETQSVTSNTCTLANVPALIQSVFLDGSGLGKVTCQMIPAAETPASGQVAVNMATGALIFFAGDSVTSIKCTYLKIGVTTVSAGTPSGTNSAPTFTGDSVNSSSVSAGTPDGSVTAS